MRFLKVILSALIVVVSLFAGLFVAAIAAVTFIIAFIVLKLRGKKRSARPFTASFSTSRPNPGQRPTRQSSGDVIDVEASEVSAEPAARLPDGR